MGWASGSILAGELIRAAIATIPSRDDRYRFYLDMIRAFEGADCDTLDECSGEDPLFERALKFSHPEHYEEES